MDSQSSPKDMGLQPTVDSEHFKSAILSIRGREPTFEDLAEALSVEKHALLEHVSGFDHLATLAADIIMGSLELPDIEEHPHWAEWAFHYAMIVRDLVIEYPILLRQLHPREGQVQYFERVLTHLTQLELNETDAFLTAVTMVSMAVGAAGSKPLGLLLSEKEQTLADFIVAVQDFGKEAPILSRLVHGETQVMEFDEISLVSILLQFCLEGIARRRGEELPNTLDFTYRQRTLLQA